MSIEPENEISEPPSSPEPSWSPRPSARWRPLLGGAALFIAALILLVSNEDRALDRESALAARLSSAILAPADELDETLEGKLIHLEAPLLASAPLRDHRIPVEIHALRLDRRVQMYQWDAQKTTREEISPSGEKGRVEVESYAKIWSEEVIDSSKFADTIHANPAFPFRSHRFEVSSPRLGKLRVPVDVIRRLSSYEILPADPEIATLAEEATLGRAIAARGDHYYVGESPEAPQIGDLRVIYRYIPEGILASGIGQQLGDTLSAFSFRDETLPSVVLPGSHTAHALFASSPDPFARWVNLIRGLALLLLIGALFIVFQALTELRAREGWFGDLLHGGAALNSLVFGLGLGVSIIGIVWIAAAHYAGLAFIVLGLGIAIFGGRHRLHAGAKTRSRRA